MQGRRRGAMPLVPVAVAAALAGAVPWAVKRRFRPPVQRVPHTPGHLGLPGREVWLPGPRDKRLHGWWVPVAHEAPAVVFVHGWGASASLMLPFARPIHAAGFHAFFLDARGHGSSDADDYASMPRFSEDAEAALGWVERQARVTNVGVVGHSIGAGAAALLATRRQVGALVSVSGVADVWEVIATHPSLHRLPVRARAGVRWTMERVFEVSFADIAPERVISRVSAPTLIVHGDADEIVPLDHAFRLTEARREARLVVVPGGNHGDLSTFEPHLAPILGFLSAHLSAR